MSTQQHHISAEAEAARERARDHGKFGTQNLDKSHVAVPVASAGVRLTDDDRRTLEKFRGTFADGYDPEDITNFANSLSSVEVMCLWDESDGEGYSGDSELFGRAKGADGGTWHPFSEEAFSYLVDSDEEVGADRPAPETLLSDEAAPSSIPAEFTPSHGNASWREIAGDVTPDYAVDTWLRENNVKTEIVNKGVETDQDGWEHTQYEFQYSRRVDGKQRQLTLRYGTGMAITETPKPQKVLATVISDVDSVAPYGEDWRSWASDMGFENGDEEDYGVTPRGQRAWNTIRNQERRIRSFMGSDFDEYQFHEEY